MFFLFLINGRLYTRKQLSKAMDEFEEMKEQLALSGNNYYMQQCSRYEAEWTNLNIEFGNMIREKTKDIIEKDQMIMRLDEQVRVLQNRLVQYGLPADLNAPGGERAALNVPASAYMTDSAADVRADKHGRNSKGQFTKKKPHEGSSIPKSKSVTTAGMMNSQGYSVNQIANRLKVSEETVRNYIRRYKTENDADPVVISAWNKDGVEAQVDYSNGIPLDEPLALGV